MRQTEGLKILFADEKQSGIVNRGDGCRISAAIEHGKLSDSTAGSINAQHLLTAAGGAFEDADMARLDYIEAGARLAFSEDDLTRLVAPRNRALRQEGQLVFGQAREKRCFRERLPRGCF